MFEKKFPMLRRKINGRPLVYLDNASTTQKPLSVIKAVSGFYKKHNANIHRGIHTLSQEATQMYEAARDKVQKFVGAKHREEIIFTSSATEAINLVVWSWGHDNIRAGDEILLTEAEHHSNLVPWQILAKKKRAKLKFIPINHDGRLDLKNLSSLITSKTKIVSVVHVSNVLGAINPIEKIIKTAHNKNTKVLIDGAQAGAHVPLNVQKLDCDFYVLACHKMYAPSGVGVLYGKKELLASMSPYRSGSHMVKTVNSHTAKWADLPSKFEAGTGNIEGIIGLGKAIDFIEKIGWPAIKKHESQLTAYTLKKLLHIPGTTIYGPQIATNRIGVISFNLEGIPPHDLDSVLDELGIAMRTGHHCAIPLCAVLGIESSARISLAIYNTKQDIDKFIGALKHAAKLLR